MIKQFRLDKIVFNLVDERDDSMPFVFFLARLNTIIDNRISAVPIPSIVTKMKHRKKRDYK